MHQLFLISLIQRAFETVMDRVRKIHIQFNVVKGVTSHALKLLQTLGVIEVVVKNDKLFQWLNDQMWSLLLINLEGVMRHTGQHLAPTASSRCYVF